MSAVPLGGSVSPPNGGNGQWNGVQYVSDGSYGMGAQKELPIPGGVNFMGSIVPPKKVTRDGQPPKRRGPKPDSKPAQTRRQELNRQAQRTHRERKEQYIKSLEVEISYLRESYTNDINNFHTQVNQQKEALRQYQEENVVLKELLRAHGIPFQSKLDGREIPMPNIGSLPPPMYARSQSASSHTAGYSSVTPTGTTVGALTPSPRVTERSFSNAMGSTVAPSTGGTSYHSHSPPDTAFSERGIKVEDAGVQQMPGVFEKDPQLGIDFILALERTCRDHSEYLVRRSVNSKDDPEEAQISGHALMASCPPPSHISSTPAQKMGLVPTYPHQTAQIPHENLMTLLNLSRRMVEEGDIEGGQITPIMALQHLRSHTKYYTLTQQDVRGMIDSLNSKVRCYGFGAVMEDFELMDALSSIFATKPETYEETFGDANDDDMYG